VAGDWVLVHAGFALNVLDEAEAKETWEYLEEAGLAELPTEMTDQEQGADPKDSA
jgi:hydrogenase assembly chaperone HypC/HupF